MCSEGNGRGFILENNKAGAQGLGYYPGREDLTQGVVLKPELKNEQRSLCKAQGTCSWQGNSMCKGLECSRN